ncbi:MAG: type II secretion system protein [Rhodoferax sp.]|nr:type II secretion system protein [Rhodoferax sp.]
MPTGSRQQAGLTYIGLLIAVVFFGLGAVGAARLLASTERAEREAELLFIGHQFRQAIQSYLQTGPNAGRYPPTLADLLQDRRSPTPRHHLRRLYVDPITGKADWGLVLAPEGGIMGVHSLSEREPQKRAKFDAADADFELALQRQQARGQAPTSGLQPLAAASSAVQLTPLEDAPYSYRDWKFVYRLPLTGGARQPAGGG